MDDRVARKEGDVVRTALAPMAGAVLGGLLALQRQRGATVQAVTELARASFAGTATLDGAWRVVVARSVPLLLAAFAGALVVGNLQTRGTWLGFRAVGHEGRRPAIVVALAGSAALGAVLIDTLRALVGLHAAEPAQLGRAAARAVTHALLMGLAVIAVSAVADHLLKAHARRKRLGSDAPAVRQPPPQVVDEGRAYALVQDADVVLFDEDRAVAIVLHAGVPVLWARGRGLAALALREAARIHGKKLRAADVALLDAVGLGTPVPEEQRVALGLA